MSEEPRERRPGSTPRRWALLLESARHVDPGVWAILAVFLSLTVPHLGSVPIWDSRQYYEGCLMQGLRVNLSPFELNCWGHPSMLYMLLLVPGQLLSPGSVVLLNLTNVILGCVGIGAFWALATVFLPDPGRRSERLLATGLFAVWPTSLGSCLSPTPDYGVLVFFLLFLALLLTDRIGAAAVAGFFLVMSKEYGVLLYGMTTAVFIATRFFQSRAASLRRRWRESVGKWVLLTPGILCAVGLGVLLVRPGGAVWGATTSASRAMARFVLFNPLELFFGRYGPVIWVLSFTWILSLSLLAAVVALVVFRSARVALQSIPVPRARLQFLLLLFVAAVLALTRYETYANVRYFLPLAPLLILTAVVLLEVTIAWAVVRRAALGIVLLLLLGSNFRTFDPVSRSVWGTFSFGRHHLLQMTSWSNECCGYGRDQLVYNLEYLKFHELENAIFRDIRPGIRTTFVADDRADWFLAGEVTLRGDRVLRPSNAVRVHFVSASSLERRPAPPEAVYFVSFPNFDNSDDLRELRRNYQAVSLKVYERSGYSIPVYKLRRKGPAVSRGAQTVGAER